MNKLLRGRHQHWAGCCCGRGSDLYVSKHRDIGYNLLSLASQKLFLRPKLNDLRAKLLRSIIDWIWSEAKSFRPSRVMSRQKNKKKSTRVHEIIHEGDRDCSTHPCARQWSSDCGMQDYEYTPHPCAIQRSAGQFSFRVLV